MFNVHGDGVASVEVDETTIVEEPSARLVTETEDDDSYGESRY